MPRVDIDPDENTFVIEYKEPSEVIQTALDEALADNAKLKTKINRLENRIEKLNDKIRLIAAIFVPFLQKLLLNPEKDLLEWPDRVSVVSKKLDKLLALTDTKED